MENSSSDFYSHWHVNRKTRKRRKKHKDSWVFCFQHGCFTAKNLYRADQEQRRTRSARWAEWLELCVIIGFSSRTAYVNPTWTSLLKAHAMYLYTGMLKMGKKHMSAHVLFTLVSHLRDGPARLHAQTVPLYSQTEAGSWTGAIPSANEVNPHKRGGGDCNYLSVFPQKNVLFFLRMQDSCLTASDYRITSTLWCCQSGVTHPWISAACCISSNAAVDRRMTSGTIAFRSCLK